MEFQPTLHQLHNTKPPNLETLFWRIHDIISHMFCFTFLSLDFLTSLTIKPIHTSKTFRLLLTIPPIVVGCVVCFQSFMMLKSFSLYPVFRVARNAIFTFIILRVKIIGLEFLEARTFRSAGGKSRQKNWEEIELKVCLSLIFSFSCRFSFRAAGETRS